LSERSLRSYLLLPRPGDLIKAWLFPAAFGLGVLGAGGIGAGELLRAAIVWLALELLIYQARYQWNDIRGFAADQRHPDRVARGRLPGPPSLGPKHIRASWRVVLIRLGLVALLALALGLAPLGLLWPPLALTIAVFGVAVLYEALRSGATPAPERVPPPLTPRIVALWCVVGGGYAIRGIAGLSLAVDLLGNPALLASATVAFWAFGVAFVTGRWALEALAFARRDSRGRVEWQVEAGQAREHSLALARWLPRSPDRIEVRQEADGLADWKALRYGVPALAPWNLAAVLAAVAAAVAGRILVGPAALLEAALAGLGGGLGAAAVLALPRWRWQGSILGALSLGALLANAGSPRPALAALPWLLLLGAHLFFTSQSPRTLPHPLRNAMRAISLPLSRSRHRPAFVPLVRR
jgi:hypothetical protein